MDMQRTDQVSNPNIEHTREHTHAVRIKTTNETRLHAIEIIIF